MTRIPPTPAQLAWEKSLSPAITSDILWNLDAYRVALYLLFCVQEDLKAINALEEVKDQLIRAAGDLGAAVAEGYSRSTKADRVRFYGYALGSSRECIVWYQGLRDQLPETTLSERLFLVSRSRSLILGLIKSERTNSLPAKVTRPAKPRGRFEP